MEALEPSGFDDSVTFPTGADIDLIREAITFRHRDMSCFGPQHLQELLLAFQYLLCSTAWEPRIYSLAALLSIPLIGSALAAEQLITDIIDRDVAHELSDLCGRDINEVKALQDSLIFTPCKSISLLKADRKEDILGPSPIVDKALDFWRTFLSCPPLRKAFESAHNFGFPYTNTDLLSLQSDAPVCRIVDTLLRPILFHLWECLYGRFSGSVKTRKFRPSITKCGNGQMFDEYMAQNKNIPMLYFFIRNPRRECYLSAASRTPSLKTKFPRGTPVSDFLVASAAHLLLASPAKPMPILPQSILISASASSALGLSALGSSGGPDSAPVAPLAPPVVPVPGAPTVLVSSSALAPLSTGANSALGPPTLGSSGGSRSAPVAPGTPVDDSVTVAPTVLVSSPALAHAVEAMPSSSPSSLISASPASDSSVRNNPSSLSSSSLGPLSISLNSLVPDCLRTSCPLNIASSARMASGQYNALIGEIFSLRILGIFENNMFPAVAMAFLSAVTDGVVTVEELGSFVTRLLSSLQSAQISSKLVPILSDGMVDNIKLSRLEGSADGGCGPDVILLHPALRGIYRTLGRQTSTKLIRHVTYSLVEFVTGRRTATGYPTLTDRHGFDPSISETLEAGYREIDGYISPSFLSVMSYITGASCSIIIPTPERGGIVFGLASVASGDANTTRAITKAWSGNRHPIIHNTVVQTANPRSGMGHFFAIGACLDALGAPPEGAHLYPSQVCDSFLSKVVAQMADAPNTGNLPIYYAINYGSSYRQSTERISHTEMFPRLPVGPVLPKRVSFSTAVGAKVARAPRPRSQTPKEPIAALAEESSINVLNFNKSDPSVLRRFLRHFNIKTDNLHISIPTSKLGTGMQRTAVISFPDKKCRESFLEQFRTCATDNIIGYRLNVSPERPSVKSSSYDPRNSFNIHRDRDDLHLTPKALAQVLENLPLNRALMKPREQQQVALRIRTQARVLRSSTPDSRVDLLLLPDLALALRIHRLLLAASTRGGQSPLSRHGFHLSQLLSPPEAIDPAWHLPRKPWLPRSPGLNNTSDASPRGQSPTSSGVSSTRRDRPISIIKRSDPGHPEFSLPSPSGSVTGSRFAVFQTLEDDSPTEHDSTYSPDVSPSPSPQPSSRAVEQGVATTDMATVVSSPESLNTKDSCSCRGSSDTSATVVSSPVLERSLDSMIRRKLRPPAGSRQSDLDRMAFDVVAIAQRSWPKVPLDSNESPESPSDGSESSSFLQFLRHVTEYFRA